MAVYTVRNSASHLHHWARMTSDRRFVTACSVKLTLYADPESAKPAEQVEPGDRCRAPGCRSGWSDWSGKPDRPLGDGLEKPGETGILSAADSV